MSMRYTYNDENGCYLRGDCYYTDTHSSLDEMCCGEAIENFSAYEDITHPDGNEIISMDRLKELVEADKAGRAVVLPCKVGDTVYAIVYCESIVMDCDDDYETGTGACECPFESDCPFEECDDGNERIIETTVSGFWKDETKTDVFLDRVQAEIYVSDFGKTVFLTRAAAAAALAGKGEQHD